MIWPPQSTGHAPDLFAQDQVFVHRPPASVLRRMRWAATAWAVMWALMPVVFVAMLIASSPRSSAELWPALISWVRNEPWFWVRVHAATFATATALWVVYWAISHSPARLILNADGLQFRSGVPLLGRWLDWCYPLPTLRQMPTHWGDYPPLVGSTPEFSRRLEWRPRRWWTRRIRVAYWQAQEPTPADAPTRLPPVRHLGLVRWRTPENLAVLNANLKALPLAQALHAQGVPIPLVEARAVRSQGILGQKNVTQHPRLRWGALGVFVIMFVAAAFVPAQGFQEFVTPPPAWVPALVGLVAAALTWLALWPEPKRGNVDSGWSARELRWTKLGMATMIGWSVSFVSRPSPSA